MKDDAAPAPLPPPLLERLRHELREPTLKPRLLAYARKRVGALRLAGIPVHLDSDHEAEILVQDAVTATILGQRRWEPDVSLFHHLCGALRSETANRVKHAGRSRHVSMHAGALDDSSDDLSPLDGAMTRGRAGTAALPGHAVSTGDAVRRLMHALRELAIDKPPTVTALLDAYEDGCDGRQAVLTETGLTIDEYRSARRILDRMVRSLPHESYQGARDALEITYDA